MAVFLLLREIFANVWRKLTWFALGLVIAAHASIAYLGLYLAGEKHLLEPATFIYFYITTTATVGYGDLAPQSAGGRVFDAVWLMLGGIALITAVIAKVTNLVIELWRRNMKGRGDFSARTGHTVVVGWVGGESDKIIELLQQDDASSDDRVVLVDAAAEENPMDGVVDFVRGESLSSESLLIRAGVRGAERILVHTSSDEQTLATVLTINALNPVGHVVAHFESSASAQLARKYAPKLECTSSMATEMLVRAAQDPGSSKVFSELLCVGEGATQFSYKLPQLFASTVGDLYLSLKNDFNAVLIGYQAADAEAPAINPANSTPVKGGVIFYIADQRIEEGHFA
ncbi:ion channel [Pseudomonas aeruginosa]|jgi:voltage-gated potassium channel|uniref:Voltage-gated potassium channel n=1 Tax=Pseudomonas saponiphila TaxID=556534 RepID=A0A1H4ZNA0_9PSED|nr:potassium channel family protein [Pseudomonas saponiphila]SED31569.1 voltage-gated potassium channel [Pseudomonas saponiphila]